MKRRKFIKGSASIGTTLADGASLNEPVFSHGLLVMNTEDQIR